MRLFIKAALILAILINAACSGNENNAEIPIPQKETIQIFKTVKPQKVSYANEITAMGILSSKNEYQLSFMASGIINYLEVHEGDFVKKGQVLARINQTSVNATTNRLMLAYEKAQRDFQRVEALYKDQVVTLEDRQNAQTGLDNARLQLEAAQFNQQYATIKAPDAGKIQSVLAQKNEMIQAGSPVIIMGGNKGGKVLKANLADVDVVKVNLKDSCFVTFDAYPDTVFPAYVSGISGTSDRYTGTYEVEIYVNDPKGRLKSGFIGQALIKSPKKIEYLQIPIESLISAHKMMGEISILTKGQKKSKTIKIAKIKGEKLLISEGLSENEEIIIN